MAFDPLHLSEITDQQLNTLMLQLALACGKSHSALVKRRESWFCFLNRVLQTEAQLRGLPQPTPPYHASSVPPFVA